MHKLVGVRCPSVLLGRSLPGWVRVVAELHNQLAIRRAFGEAESDFFEGAWAVPVEAPECHRRGSLVQTKDRVVNFGGE